MKTITKLMVNEYNMKKLGFDFAGYEIKRTKDLSFHHLIVPKRNCKELGLGEGYYKWNGSILVQDTSHDYIHLIENIDMDMFLAITSQMIDMNIKGKLDVENIRRIHDIMSCFEKEHCSDRNKNGKLLIKDKYLHRIKF